MFHYNRKDTNESLKEKLIEAKKKQSELIQTKELE